MADLDRNKAVMEIEGMLNGANPIFTNECCIYKVPYEIRKLNSDAYTPKVVSIGPFHHGKDRLQNMEAHKQIYCGNFIKKAGTSVDKLVRCVQELQLEPSVRQCYSKTIDLDQEKLVKVILVDCCFIFEFFLTRFFGQRRDDSNDGIQSTRFVRQWRDDSNDGIQSTPWLMTNITVDLLLLENQLPFFVLQELYEHSLQGRDELPSFIKLTYDFFRHYNRRNLTPPAPELKKQENSAPPATEHKTKKKGRPLLLSSKKNKSRALLPLSSNATIKHFTDLIRTFHLSDGLPERQGESLTHLNSATELEERGVKFNGATELEERGVKFKAKENSPCLLDLKFTKEYLEIPALTVDHFTETLFRNMVALEQWLYPTESYITDYVAMLHYLINAAKDVDVLVKYGTIRNRLGDSKSVAGLFNGLGNNIVRASLNPHYLSICEGLNNYCEDHKASVPLRRDYCKTQWPPAVIVLLILIVIQTVIPILTVTNSTVISLMIVIVLLVLCTQTVSSK